MAAGHRLRGAAALLTAALAVAGCSSSSKSSSATTTSTSTPAVTTSTAAATSAPSASTVAPTSTTPATTVAPATTAAGGGCAAGPFATQAQADAFIATKTVGAGFRSSDHWYVFPNPKPPYDPTADLSVISATIQGATAASPEQAFFFHQGCYLGTATATFRVDITAEVLGPSQLRLTWQHYKSSDPLCCPTGAPWTVTFTWQDGHLVTDGTFPPDDQIDP